MSTSLLPTSLDLPPVGTALWGALNFRITMHCSMPNENMGRHFPFHTSLNGGVKKQKGLSWVPAFPCVPSAHRNVKVYK